MDVKIFSNMEYIERYDEELRKAGFKLFDRSSYFTYEDDIMIFDPLFVPNTIKVGHFDMWVQFDYLNYVMMKTYETDLRYRVGKSVIKHGISGTCSIFRLGNSRAIKDDSIDHINWVKIAEGLDTVTSAYEKDHPNHIYSSYGVDLVVGGMREQVRDNLTGGLVYYLLNDNPIGTYKIDLNQFPINSRILLVLCATLECLCNLKGYPLTRRLIVILRDGNLDNFKRNDDSMKFIGTSLTYCVSGDSSKNMKTIGIVGSLQTNAFDKAIREDKDFVTLANGITNPEVLGLTLGAYCVFKDGVSKRHFGFKPKKVGELRFFVASSDFHFYSIGVNIEKDDNYFGKVMTRLVKASRKTIRRKK